MEKYGPVKQVSIPKKADGKMLGYGFVIFESLKTASEAIEALNSKKFYGSTVAVDWCLPKNLFLRNQSKEEEYFLFINLVVQ